MRKIIKYISYINISTGQRPYQKITNACIFVTDTISFGGNPNNRQSNNSIKQLPDNWREITSGEINPSQLMGTKGTAIPERNQQEDMDDWTAYSVVSTFECVHVVGPVTKLSNIQLEIGDISTIALCDTRGSYSNMKKDFLEKKIERNVH